MDEEILELLSEGKCNEAIELAMKNGKHIHLIDGKPIVTPYFEKIERLPS